MSIRSNRVDAIDFVKGVLVIGMVVYHVLNYVGYDSLPRTHLGFVPLSFITITGFLIMQVYAHPDRLAAGGVGARLLMRGLKLLAIFTVLNVAATLVWSRNHYGVALGPLNFFRNYFDVYVLAEAPGVAFDVLVPIAYTILLAIPVIALGQRWHSLVAWLAFGSFLLCFVLDVQARSINSLYFVSAGVLGLWLGGRSIGEVDRGVDSSILVAILIVGYIAVAMSGAMNYAAQIYTTVVVLVVLYSIGRRVSLEGPWGRQICLLGRYSLLSYILQILLLQATRIVAPVDQIGQAAQAAVLTVFVTALMWMAIVFVEWLRRQIQIVDRLYKSVFA